MKTIQRTIEPVEGFSREIGLYLAHWDKTRAELRASVLDLSQEELAVRAAPEVHQIGNLILHIAESEAHWMLSILTGSELDEATKKLAHWNDSTETDYAGKNYTAAECIERVDRIGRMSREVLKGFSDEDLDELVAFQGSTTRFEVSLRWMLCHLIDHEANHKGQIALLKRLLRGNNDMNA